MSFDIIESWGGKCHKCTATLIKGTLMLQTRSQYGSWNYCPKCSAEKGYTIDQNDCLLSFVKKDMPLEHAIPEIRHWDELGGLNLWQIGTA